MDFNKVFIIDIETNGLLESMVDHRTFPYKLNGSARLWCTVIRCLGTDEVWTAVKEENTKEFFETVLADAEYIVAHNGIKFDFIALKLFGVLDYTVGHLGQKDTLFGKEIYFLDTLILSRLFNPDRYGGHSLDSWGERVGSAKSNFRQTLIDKELLDPKSPKGFEFTFFTEDMVEYCTQDTKVNALAFLELYKELTSYKHWFQAIRLETKLADYGVKRETLGFYFDRESAIVCVEELTEFMNEISAEVNPLLPKKKLGKTAVKSYTPPKTQIKKDGELSSHMKGFIERMKAEVVFDIDNNRVFKWEDKEFIIPFDVALKEYEDATIDDLDVVKMHLIDLGWVPTEWRERDLTKDAKKQDLPYEKRIDALRRWLQSTADGKYKKQRLEILGIKPDRIFSDLSLALEENRPIRVPTSPSLRVGVQKELCPNLLALGEKVAFAKQVALYYTYRHRKSSIAGGDIEDMDFDEEVPNTGFLSVYREEDGRVPTPAIEIGASTTRYKHVKIANIPRVTSIYGDKMRGLFGAGKGFAQIGFDFASLENRVQAGYIAKYEGGIELGVSLTAEKPNDLHSINAKKLSISRSDAKSFTYAILYGAGPPKLAKMLGVSLERGKELYDMFWAAVPALKELKDNLTNHWEKNEREYILGIDGRKIRARSPHSLLNALFQSAGVICAKYVTIFMYEEMERLGYCVDPFEGKPDVCSMIEYHDECQLACKPKLLSFELFENEKEAEQFVASWEGEQLSAISHGKNGYYVTLPNDISRSVLLACKRTEELLKLQFELGIEWIAGKNWAQCH